MHACLLLLPLPLPPPLRRTLLKNMTNIDDAAYYLLTAMREHLLLLRNRSSESHLQRASLSH